MTHDHKDDNTGDDISFVVKFHYVIRSILRQAQDDNQLSAQDDNQLSAQDIVYTVTKLTMAGSRHEACLQGISIACQWLTPQVTSPILLTLHN